MTIRTPLTEEFGIDYPVFAFTPSKAVAAAVSRAGGLGVLGAVRYNDADELDDALAALLAEADRDVALAEATTYLEAAGHVVVAWVWLGQWLATGERSDAYAEGKRAAARFFLTRELPRTAPLFDLLAARDRLLVDLDPTVL